MLSLLKHATKLSVGHEATIVRIDIGLVRSHQATVATVASVGDANDIRSNIFPTTVN